jgi:hypothetical protein
MATAGFPDPLPAFRPPVDLVPGAVREAAAAHADPSSGRALEWAAAIQTTFEREQMYRRFPGFRLASYGALHREIDGHSFGVAVHTSAPYEGIIDHGMEVGGATFPIAMRVADQVTLHRPPDPQAGTTACWTFSGRLASGKQYALTAEHVVDGHARGKGAQVALAGGGSATIEDMAPPGIDAALLDLGSGPPALPFTSVRFPAPWTDVHIDGAQSNVATTYMRTTDVVGTLDKMFPIRLFLAKAAQPGDSGALVTDQQGNGLGVYMGEVANPAGVVEGVCQHLGQAEFHMSLTLLR